MKLSESLAVVTGATQGIGRAIAFALGKRGCRVAICARGAQGVRDTLAALHDAGIDAIGAPCDVADAPAVDAFAQFVTAEREKVGVLVNNAGIARFAPVDQLSVADWDAVMGTNVRSLFLMTRAFLPALRRNGGGTIVNIASLAGRNGFAQGTAYCASKHAVLGFAKALMHEVRTAGIRVVTLCPGSVDTPFMQHQQRFAPNRKRILTPEDVAQTVVATLELPDRAMVSELDLRPSNP